MDIFSAMHSGLLNMGLPVWLANLVPPLVKAVILLLFILLNCTFLIWMERKVAGHIQRRMGPMRLGPHGIVQSIADVFKLISKEDVIPQGVDRWVFVLAPIVAFAPAFTVFMVIPFGPNLIAQDLNIALIFIAALTSFVVISFLMAGWSSNNKWSLLGAMRATAQLISYEVPLVISVAAVAMLAGSLSLQGIVSAQAQSFWYILVQPIGFLVFLTASLAELNRSPFDLSEAEQELVAGYNTEYSGMRWAMFYLTEYANLITFAAIAATLFFGGWSGPFLPPFVWFMIKVYFFIFLVMWIRWTLPRIRVDQLMDLGWKGLLPLSLVNLALTGIYVLIR